jgi:hypothetical protein
VAMPEAAIPEAAIPGAAMPEPAGTATTGEGDDLALAAALRACALIEPIA